MPGVSSRAAQPFSPGDFLSVGVGKTFGSNEDIVQFSFGKSSGAIARWA